MEEEKPIVIVDANGVRRELSKEYLQYLDVVMHETNTSEGKARHYGVTHKFCGHVNGRGLDEKYRHIPE